MTRLLRFAKGHGTGNDFVVVLDPEGHVDLSAGQVAALCDRHLGIGGDGVLRVVHSAASPDAAAYTGDAEWFMDYRNADGSIAQMCGNGVRVFARFLHQEGMVRGESLPVATRSGLRTAVFLDDGTISVDMGPARELGRSSVTVDDVELPGRAVSMGNPHLVCRLDGTLLRLATVDLSRPPAYDAQFFPEGVNVELVEPATPTDGYDAVVAMRVHERGVGETLSCGTGVCAVAASALRDAGVGTGTVRVDVPGGRLHVEVTPDAIVLRGPAVVHTGGVVDLDAIG